MHSSTVASLGSQVAMMPRPTDKGLTPRARSASTSSGGGAAATRRSSCVSGK